MCVNFAWVKNVCKVEVSTLYPGFLLDQVVRFSIIEKVILTHTFQFVFTLKMMH